MVGGYRGGVALVICVHILVYFDNKSQKYRTRQNSCSAQKILFSCILLTSYFILFVSTA